MTDPGQPAQCRSCRQTYTMGGSRDPLCIACRAQIAVWHAPERLNGLAQQGFEEAMGMRPPSNLYEGLPPDAGLTAQRWGQGTGMAAQQMPAWSDQDGAWINEAGQDFATGIEIEPVLPGQLRCRHCAAVLISVADGAWTARDDSAVCPEIGIPHQPMPEGMTGGQ